MNARGSVFKYPDNVDTDVIIPARHLNTQDAKELASHCMEDIDKDFVNRVQPGDIMVGGWNFGCGSSREHAPLCIKTAGIAVVIAKSFARIFYRNSINIGLPIMECPEAVDAIEAGDTVRVDFDTGVITDETQNVLNKDWEPIEGLYVAGNCLGGRYGFGYSTPFAGNSVGMAMTHGWTAGHQVASDKKFLGEPVEAMEAPAGGPGGPGGPH